MKRWRKKNNVDLKKAKKLLFKEEYTIRTAFDENIFSSLASATKIIDSSFDVGCAVTDLKGNLIAAYGYKNGKNISSLETAPYSALKPLSVYAPAIDAGLIHWASQYEDSPYKKIKDENGNLQDWPANHTGSYTMGKVAVCDAISNSLNTVAVKCLKDYGVKNSLKFLQEKFEIPLTEEEYVIEKYGEEEILSSLALGYLEKGVSPVDMAGYYTVFANGGTYTKPKAVLEITNSEGNRIYTSKSNSTQVISADTADIMNKLLQGVVKTGGTGENIKIPGVEVAGKTGTGDNNEANWFVGITPGYSCAIWHSSAEYNRADEIFSVALEKIYSTMPNVNKRFITHKNLHKIVYCEESCLAFSPRCTSIKMGYFAQKDALALCNIH